jgi:hypothetical protein
LMRTLKSSSARMLPGLMRLEIILPYFFAARGMRIDIFSEWYKRKNEPSRILETAPRVLVKTKEDN